MSTAVARAARSGTAARRPQRWILSPAQDLAVFGGTAALALALLALARLSGALHRPLPLWTWVAAIVCVDVAHVWATLFRVYLDPREVRRRPVLYLATPALAYAVGVALYTASPRLFWTALAYLAVFHFVRQQYGWVAIYKRLNDDRAPLDNALDAVAVYNAAVFPVLWWHGHLPREFVWLIQGDFVRAVPARLVDALLPAHLAVMAAWALRQLVRYVRTREANAGKVVVVVTTWLCWYVGIVATDSDYGFTLTNVLIHGVPYMALLWRYARNRYANGARDVPGEAPREPGAAEWVVARGALAFVAVLVVLALAEEALWDLCVWHDRAQLFGDAGVSLSRAALRAVVPLLALPQATHYALDGFVWRSGNGNPTLLRDLGLAARPTATRGAW
jgi:hypothetical protein